jgi:hypothetical protein
MQLFEVFLKILEAIIDAFTGGSNNKKPIWKIILVILFITIVISSSIFFLKDYFIVKSADDLILEYKDTASKVDFYNQYKNKRLYITGKVCSSSNDYLILIGKNNKISICIYCSGITKYLKNGEMITVIGYLPKSYADFYDKNEKNIKLEKCKVKKK